MTSRSILQLHTGETKMIYVKWIYKGAVISVTPVNIPYSHENVEHVKDLLAQGILSPPENHEKYIITDCEDGGLYVG